SPMVRTGASVSIVLSCTLPGTHYNALRSVLVPGAVARTAASPSLRPTGTAFALRLLVDRRFLHGGNRLLLVCLRGFRIGAMAASAASSHGLPRQVQSETYSRWWRKAFSYFSYG